MSIFKPKFITFDCYGTLTRFQMSDTARTLYGDRVAEADMPFFLRQFAAYRLGEVLDQWKPYEQVVKNSIKRLPGAIAPHHLLRLRAPPSSAFAKSCITFYATSKYVLQFHAFL